MSKTDFDAGDLICVKKIDPDDLEVGDIISYVSEYAGNYGSIVTHKIREKVKSNLLIDAKITLAEPKSLERYVNGKAKRVHDLRNIK